MMVAKQTILVTGANGQVGWALMQRAQELELDVVGGDRNWLDINDEAAVRDCLQRYPIALVINAAAYTAVDKAEQEPDLAYLVNEQGPKVLAQACAEQGIPLFHISTDYVFTGDECRPYRETDSTGPTGVYGLSKLNGELAVQEALPEHVILRTSWVFGIQGGNFVKTMVRLAQEHKHLRVVADQLGCPTYAGDIAEALLQLAQRYLKQGLLDWGLYHYSGLGQLSWHQFATLILKRADELGVIANCPTIEAIATSAYPTPAQRPAYSVLDCNLFEQAFNLSIQSWEAGMESVLQSLLTETQPMCP